MKNNKGITMTSLIVTIIVMVILAGIALLFSVGEEGVISRTHEAIEKQNKAGIEEKIELVFSSYALKDKTGQQINNKEVTNDILDIFEYPNIDKETGLLIDGDENGTLEEDNYIVTSEEGTVEVTEKQTFNTLLKVTYDINNEPYLEIIYNGKIYKYVNFKLESVTPYEYYVAGNPADWTFSELADGTLKITGYKGSGEPDKDNPEILNLTIPNKLDGKIVSTIAATSGFDNINGTLTISSGVTVTSLKIPNVKKVILKEDIIAQCILGGNYTTDLIVGSGCNIQNGSMKWVNVEIGKNVVFGHSGKRCFDSGTISLSKQSISNILGTTMKSEGWYTTFFNCNFINSPDIVIPENSNINSINFRGCTNIKTITIKKESKVVSNAWNNSVFHIGNCQIDKITVEDDCNIGVLIYVGDYGNGSAISVKEIEIGDNVALGDRALAGVSSVEKIILGKNVSIASASFKGTTFADNVIIEMYLTDEQKEDNSKIPTLWFESSSKFTKKIENDKVIWTTNSITE